MQHDSADLATLIGSRICHDLISPIGAISNGLELLSLSGTTGLGPEIELINDSCTNATARIRFFRVAFGTTATSQKLGRSEIRGILGDIGQGARLRTEWQPAGDQIRREVQLAFLALLCFETAMPHGGNVTFELLGNKWRIEGTAPRISVDADLWRMLTDQSFRVEVSPARVQFLMLQVVAQEMERTPKISHSEGRLVLDL